MRESTRLIFAIVVTIAIATSRIAAALTTDNGESTPMGSFKNFDERATAGATVSVVFFGGSLTWGANASDPQRTSYRALMGEYLQRRYPKTSFTFHDASIGGTGSLLGTFRVDRDVLALKPDLVFLDFTLNDGLNGDDAPTLDAYESILHRLVASGAAVEQVILAGRGEFNPNAHAQDLKRVVAHKKLSAAYGTALGDIYPWVNEKITSKKVTLDELWPFDGTHPDDAGYREFFEAVRRGFEKAVKDDQTCRIPETASFGITYLKLRRTLLVDSSLPVGWKRARTYRTSAWFDGLSSRWMGDVAVCDVKDRDHIAPLTLQFNGTFCGIFGEADIDGLGFEAMIDGKPVNSLTTKTEVQPGVWSFTPPPPGKLFVWRVLSTSLSSGEHTLTLKPFIPAGLTKGQLRIESVCTAGR